MKRIPLLAASIAMLAPLSAQAAEGDYIARYEGRFSGKGTVVLESIGRPVNVTCTLTGNGSATAIDMRGTCRAAIFSRSLAASLSSVGPRYRGQYTGSKNGAAALSGRRSGDTVRLAVTWPKPVYGDRDATMTLTNSGAGGFTFRVTDRKDGKAITTTDIRFRKQ